MLIIRENELRGAEKPPWKLTHEIIERSVADNWHDARGEWELEGIERADSDKPGTCLCGHFPIIKLCRLRNRENEHGVTVGSCCVTRFIGIDTDKLFRSLLRIADNLDKALSKGAAEFAHSQGWINNWELNFCINTARKGRLSPRESAKRRQLNAKVLDRSGLRIGGPTDA